MNTQEEILHELKKLNFIISRSTVAGRGIEKLWKRHSEAEVEDE